MLLVKLYSLTYSDNHSLSASLTKVLSSPFSSNLHFVQSSVHISISSRLVGHLNNVNLLSFNSLLI